MGAPKTDKPTAAGTTLHLGAALDRSQPLALLLQRLQGSRERFEAIRQQLPEALRDQVRPGPLDDARWTLLVSNGAAGSKLRQLLPALEATLHARGWQGTSIRIKVQSS
jgi:hypothetical protein